MREAIVLLACWDQILSPVAEVEYAGGPSNSAEGARRDLWEGQQGDEEQPGQGDDVWRLKRV